MSSNANTLGLGLDVSEWLEIQGKLLSGQLSRISMTELLAANSNFESDAKLNVRIWRNYAVEPMETTFRVLGLYWGIGYQFEYMGYDDSLSFVEISNSTFESDIELIFVDRAHYQLSSVDFDSWLKSREDQLAAITNLSVITVVVDEQITIRMSGIVVLSFGPESENESHFDSRYERTTGSRLTPRTHFLIARELSATWVASLGVPPRKLIAVDLDFTLHDGILGEISNEVKVSAEYSKLQRQLLEAKSRGYMLAIISKNELRDVLQLLNSHPNYLLKESDFVAIEASWDSKQAAMSRILEMTRINQDAVIFIDDNPIELLQMKLAYPNLGVVSAMEGAQTACLNLNYVPGYRREGKDNLGDIRVADIQSNEDRLALIQNGLKTYYQSAKPILKVSVQESEQLERLVDLGKRSNQFNLQLSRLGQSDYQTENSVWVGLSLSDQFSDSGIIGGIVLRKVSNTECAVLELFLSCRVLGRGLETALICQGILEGMRYLQATNIQISWIIGERNEPALNWLASVFLDESPVLPGSVTMSDAEIMAFAQPPQGVQVEVKDGN